MYLTTDFCSAWVIMCTETSGNCLEQVGGALCLLNEVREAEVVLQAGQALLAQQEDLPKTLNRDVVLAMALSYVELSREAMAETPSAVVKSCSLLESALKLLRVGIHDNPFLEHSEINISSSFSQISLE